MVDFPIHPPRQVGDPFDLPMLDNLNFSLKMVDGVMHVYENDDSMAQDKPIEWPYPDRQSYLAELNIMLSLISDGPLYVIISIFIDYIKFSIILQTLCSLGFSETNPTPNFGQDYNDS